MNNLTKGCNSFLIISNLSPKISLFLERTQRYTGMFSFEYSNNLSPLITRLLLGSSYIIVSSGTKSFDL
jgi:hypothetical protein